jgi:hypothetical protein
MRTAPSINVVVQRSTGLDIQQQEDGSVDLLPFGEVNVSLTFSLSALYYNLFRVLSKFVVLIRAG